MLKKLLMGILVLSLLVTTAMAVDTGFLDEDANIDEFKEETGVIVGKVVKALQWIGAIVLFLVATFQAIRWGASNSTDDQNTARRNVIIALASMLVVIALPTIVKALLTFFG